MSLGLVTNLPLSILMKPARQTTSTLASSRAAVIWSSKSSRHLYTLWLITCKVQSYHITQFKFYNSFISIDMKILMFMVTLESNIFKVIKYRWFVWSNINNADSQSCLILIFNNILSISCTYILHTVHRFYDQVIAIAAFDFCV